MEHPVVSVSDGAERRSGELTSSSGDASPNTPEMTEKNVEKEPEYPTGLPLALIMLGLCLAVFTVALDNTIIATAIPKITDRFNSLDDVGWYASAYLLTTGAFQLLFGRFYSTFSIKWVFISSITIFEFGSLICAVTPSSIGLIVGRAIAGLGCAGIFSGALIILAQVVPLRSRPTYMGMIGGMYGIASVCGPLLGGVFTDKVTWRLCFYINLPLGFVTIIAIIFLYKEQERPAVESIGWKARVKTFDPTGNLFLMPAIISLFLALQWGGTKYPWGSARIIALMVVFGVLITGFIFVQFASPENAMIPPRLIRQRSIWAACAFNFCMSGAFFILSYYLPIWFQAVKGVSAIRSGIMNIPLILGVVFASMISGVGTTVVGYYAPFMCLSTVIMSIGYGMLTTFDLQTGSPAWIGWQAMAGLGIGLGMQLPLIAAQTVLPVEDLPIGTALVVFTQTLGGAIFVCIAQSIFTNKLLHYCAEYAPEVNPFTILGIGATRIHSLFEGEVLEALKRAYNDAIMQTFLVGVVIAALTVVGAAAVEWRSVKDKKKEDAEATVTTETKAENELDALSDEKKTESSETELSKNS